MINLTTAADQLAILEDALVDLRTLTKIVLYLTEVASADEFTGFRCELNTMFYMMTDKIMAIERAHGALVVAACQRTAAESARLETVDSPG